MLQQIERCWPMPVRNCLVYVNAEHSQPGNSAHKDLQACYMPDMSSLYLVETLRPVLVSIDRLCIYEHTVVTSAALVIAIHSKYVCTCLLLALTIRLHNGFFKPFRVGHVRMVRHSLS